MMHDVSAAKAAQAAKLSPFGSPEYYLACQVCLLRGLNPDAGAVLFGPDAPALTNWQRVIAEQIIESLLRIQLRNGPSVPSMGAKPGFIHG